MTTLISEAYRAEQEFLHFTHPKKNKYGSGGPQWAETIKRLALEHHCVTLLDYGCGKGLLAGCLTGFSVQSYDPAVAKFRTMPSKADMVVCLDVLEHIELEKLNAVLSHMIALADRFLFVAISQKVAGRTLRDGRNAHLIIRDGSWWQRQFEDKGCALATTFVTQLPEFVALFRR